MTWIRFEKHARYHLVWSVSVPGHVHTWCDRSVADGSITDATRKQPRFRCNHCVRRQARPHLIPQHMQAMFRQAAANEAAAYAVRRGGTHV